MSNILRKSIRQLLIAGGASVIAAGVMTTASAALGVQNPPPGPYQVPDYFGVVPNFANSPQPSMAQVVITDSELPGAGATVSFSTDAAGAITGINVTKGGSGYVNPKVVITDPDHDLAGAPNAIATPVLVSGVVDHIDLANGGSGYTASLQISIVEGTRGAGAIAAATTFDYANGVPTNNIMDVQLLNGGADYSPSTKVEVVNDTGAVVTLTPIIVNGVITGFQEIPNPLPAGWTGLESTDIGTSFKQPLAGTGIRKFVDSMPGLNSPNNLGQQIPVAVADTTTFPGSDYYEIAEVEYTQKMHTDLPPTHLRGYVQIKAGGFNLADFDAAADKIAYANQYAGYLGPTIIAQKDRPVRIKLVNKLSKTTDATGLKGDLPFPVDHTYMGAELLKNGAATNNTDNRTAMHLHGGNTPWISDGLPRQWVKPAGEAGNNRGESARHVPDMWFSGGALFVDASGAAITNPTQAQIDANNLTNDPGQGALTFYYTNQQSQRMMFYHDHAEGITRLNVYDGMAAGYVLQDPTELQLINDGVIPDDMIPLVIQDKTYVPDDSQPVLNFYGPFRSQLNSQDPTWRWGTEPVAGSLTGNGDLWVPHIFMPNQNPGDQTGSNAMGRWDYGPWFWPPFVGIQHEQVPNPYFDPACDVTTGAGVNPLLGSCEGQFMPGTPNGATKDALGNPLVQIDSKGNVAPEMSEPSASPEAFNDVMTVNGTVYPYVNVSPKKYRLRILSVGNDRNLNLSLVVASSKNGPSTAANANVGATSATALANTCDGAAGHKGVAEQPNCTEVRMVPFNAPQDKISHFPTWWYTAQKTGVTFDGRPSGVFDPAVRGPAMVQIGTEGGFLSSPAVVKNQPVNFEYNVKNIVVTNIKEHALLLGPAERADVVVDFSQFAGSTLIMYNDTPAPVPAADMRWDYYTYDFDNTDTGGAMMTQPGYGPNTRTIMQFRVAADCTGDLSGNCGNAAAGGINRAPAAAASTSQDDVDAAYLTKLTDAVRHAFATTQEHIIVPQAAYNATYNMAVSDLPGVDLSRINDNSLQYKPMLAVDSVSGQATLDSVALKMDFHPKTIIEDWTMDYGRMNTILGVEMPRTTAINQTSMPFGYADPGTELVKLSEHGQPISGTAADGTQLWKITHNGVDSHPIHFHLFHVQLVNRVGWDGAIRGPEMNELGWKDIVRMNPLEDVVVALRPKNMTLPFKLGNSHRLQDPSEAPGAAPNPAMTFNLDPTSGNRSNVTNLVSNYGWEYVWHCHILGHEENDMMRSVAVAAEPQAPSGLTATATPGAAGVVLNWTDNSVVANWFTITRGTDATFANPQTFYVSYPECESQNGCARTYTDTTALADTNYVYKVVANNTVGAGEARVEAGRNPITGAWIEFLPTTIVDGATGAPSALTPKFTGFASVTASSTPSNIVGAVTVPTMTLSNAALDFGSWLTGTRSTLQVVTVTNTGSAPLAINAIAVTGEFIETHTCGASLAVNASCSISVKFQPTTAGVKAESLTVTGAGIPQVVTLNATAVNAVAPVVTASLLPTPPTTVKVDWLPSSTVANQADSYQLQRGIPLATTGLCPTTDSNYSNIGAATKLLTANDATMTLGQKYCYRVVASNAAGKYTGYASIVTIPTAPAAPATLDIESTTVTPTTLNLIWAASTSAGVTGYEVQKCVGLTATGNCKPTGAGWVKLATTAATKLNVANLNTGTPYLFRVRAFNPLTSAWTTSDPKFAYPLAKDNAVTSVAAVSTANQAVVTTNTTLLLNDLPTGVPNCSTTVLTDCRRVLPVTVAVPANRVSGGDEVVTYTPIGTGKGTLTRTAVPATASVLCAASTAVEPTATGCTLTAVPQYPAGTYTAGGMPGTTVATRPAGWTTADVTAFKNLMAAASKRGVYNYDYTMQFDTFNYGFFNSVAKVNVTVK